MLFEEGKYYHVFNRSNNRETIFPSPENCSYFLARAGHFLLPAFTLNAYCLMPTHFHFLLRAKKETEICSDAIGRLLSSYTKALNKRTGRRGSLFQPHSRSILIDDEEYLLTLLTYIHQNPIRAGLASTCAQWEFSSHHDYAGTRCSPIVDTSLLKDHFKTAEAYERYASELLPSVKQKYWI